MMKTLALLVSAALLIGCATATKMNRVSVGMTKADVIETMGDPVSTASPGGGVEVMRYHLFESADRAFHSLPTEYFVRLVDGRVEQYGRMGDFNSTKDPALNVNIRTQ